MRDFFKFNAVKLTIGVIIFLIGIFSYGYMLGCHLSYVKSISCTFSEIVSFIFAFDLFLALWINNFFNLPFNDFSSPIAYILQAVYSYLTACVLYWVFKAH